MENSSLYNPYEGVELLERFQPLQFEQYCIDKLKSTEKHVSFIKNLIAQGYLPAEINVVEVGSGNGKLLFKLAQEGLLKSGLGYEISKSRTEFGKKFQALLSLQLSEIQLINENFLDSVLQSDTVDLIIGIDVVINLIGPISETSINNFFEKAYHLLTKGGCCILEFMTCERELFFIQNSFDNIHRPWKQFSDTDPFIFGLDQLSMNGENIYWEKRFIKRDTGAISYFKHLIMPISKSVMQQHADKYGFKATFFDRWKDADDTSDQEYIAVLQKV